MEKMQKDLPEDVKYSYGFDNTKFIRASISEVKETVYVAFILVIIIIFLFLARLACYAGSLHRDSGIVDRCFLRYVSGGLLHQRALHAGCCAGSGSGGGRRYRNDGKHLCPH